MSTRWWITHFINRLILNQLNLLRLRLSAIAEFADRRYVAIWVTIVIDDEPSVVAKIVGLTGHFCGKTCRRVSLLPRRRVYGTPSRYRKATASMSFEMPGEEAVEFAGVGPIPVIGTVSNRWVLNVCYAQSSSRNTRHGALQLSTCATLPYVDRTQAPRCLSLHTIWVTSMTRLGFLA